MNTRVRRLHPAERFLSKIDMTGECWVWTASLDGKGYGQFFVGQSKFGAHRWSYELLVGPIPEGLHVDHLCRNRACVNPDHLEPVTPAENSLRGIGFGAKNAAKTHCPQGHPYDAEHTYTNPSTGHRLCRTCHRERSRADMARRRAEARSTMTPKAPKARRGEARQTTRSGAPAEKTHCINGHEYTPENTYLRPDKGEGRRDCRECVRDRVQRYKQRKKVTAPAAVSGSVAARAQDGDQP